MLTLTCLVYSNSEETVDITWLYPPELAGVVTVNGDTLMVDRLNMAANISCVVTQRGTGASAQAAAFVTLGKVYFLVLERLSI